MPHRAYARGYTAGAAGATDGTRNAGDDARRVSETRRNAAALRQIFISTLTGRTFAFAVAEEATVGGLKELCWGREGLPPNQQRLVFNGKQLEDGRTLGSCGVGEGDTVHLILRLGMLTSESGKSGFAEVRAGEDVSEGVTARGDAVAFDQPQA